MNHILRTRDWRDCNVENSKFNWHFQSTGEQIDPNKSTGELRYTTGIADNGKNSCQEEMCKVASW